MTLRKLLISAGPVAVGQLQLALQWQYELLRSSHGNRPSVDGTAEAVRDRKCDGVQEAARLLRTSPSTAASGMRQLRPNPPPPSAHSTPASMELGAAS